MWRCVVGSVVPDVSKDRSDTKRFLQQRESEEHLPSSIMVCACVCVTESDVCVWTWPVGDRTDRFCTQKVSSWQQAGSEIKDVLHSCVFFKVTGIVNRCVSFVTLTPACSHDDNSHRSVVLPETHKLSITLNHLLSSNSTFYVGSNSLPALTVYLRICSFWSVTFEPRRSVLLPWSEYSHSRKNTLFGGGLRFLKISVMSISCLDAKMYEV